MTGWRLGWIVAPPDLMRRARLGLAPGVAFGPAGEGHLRLCFAASLPRLSQALDRLVPALG